MPTTNVRDDEQDLLVVHNVLNEGFTAEWGGQPFSVAIGEDKIYPRFIAEHIAKHMADRFLLMKEERLRLESKKKLHYSLLNDQAERSKIVAEILPKVYQKYNEQAQMTEQEKLDARIDQANQEFKGDTPVAERAMKIEGPIPNKALGTLEEHTEPPAPDESTVANPSAKAEKPSKKQLLEEAKELGIKTTGKESPEELMEKITKEFA